MSLEKKNAKLVIKDKYGSLVELLDTINLSQVVTQTNNGLMSFSDKSKLDSIVVNDLALKSDLVTDTATTTTDGLMSSSDKTKLDGLSQYPRITTYQTLKYGTNVSFTGISSGTVNDSIISKTSESTFRISAYKGIKINYFDSNTDGHGQPLHNLDLGTEFSEVIGDGITVNNNIISVPEYDGATSSTAGTSGLVPAALSTERNMYLRGDGEWVNANNEDVITLTNSTIDLSLGRTFKKTITSTTTFTINVTNDSITSTQSTIFNLMLVNGGNYTINWPSSVKWINASVPSLTTNGLDVLSFITFDGGTTWYGSVFVYGISVS